MNRDAKIAIAAVVVILVAAPAMVVVATSLTHESTAGVTYQTNDGLTVTLTDDRTVEASPFDDDATFADGNLRISGGGGEISIGDDAYEGDPIVVTDVDTDDGIRIDRTDMDRPVTIDEGDVTQLQIRDYELDNETEDFAYASDGGFTMTIEDQPGVGVAAVDASTGDVLDSDIVESAGGDATLSLPQGTRSVELQKVPSELQVRNEAEPDELIDEEEVELRIRAFFDEDGDEQVVNRTVEDGTVSLEGLPADKEIVVTVREENADFVFRRILIENIVQTSEIYLLPTAEPSAEVQFELQDQTGRFPADETRFIVEKPIERDGETSYRPISGDRLSAGGQFPTILEDSERYRLRVQNEDGEQRVLGSYVVQGAQVEPIPIGDVTFAGDVEGDPAMQASLREAADEADHNHEARIVYVDPEGETDALTINIEDGEGNEIRPETTETLDGTTDIYVETFPLNESFDPEEDTATVTVEADRGFETETFTRTLGDIPDIFQDVPVNPQLLEMMFLASIVAVAGLLVIVNPAIAALVASGYAGLLVLVGLVPIPMPWVVLAGSVSMLAVVGTNWGLR